MRIIKFTLVALLLATIFALACKKSNTSTGVPADAEYFMFGKVGGFCPTVCVQNYKIVGNKVYKSYIDSASHLQYSDTPMSSDKYAMALPAMTEFPAYFTLHPNTSITCPNCADMGFIHFEYKSKGKVYQWAVDYPYEGIPPSLLPYMDKVNNIMATLQ